MFQCTSDGVAELIRGALKRGHESSRVRRLLGYSIDELRLHLERQFTKGMTWDEFMKGKIHIDHIIPKSSFNMNDPNEWRTCWSLSNLRPLSAKDNRKKRDKRLFLI